MKPSPYPIEQPNNAPQAKKEQQEYWEWGKINPDLLAQIYVVDKDGNSKKGGYRVVCAITEGTFEVGSDYSSPFADANLDQRFPTLMAAIQNGELVSGIGGMAGGVASSVAGVANSALNSSNPVVAGVSNALSAAGTVTGAVIGAIASTGNSILDATLGINLQNPMEIYNSLGNKIEQMQGRSNFTKINSTQIFVSTKPIEISVTLYFRAWRNAKKEVEEPVSTLESWCLPVSMGESIRSGLFSTVIPPFVALQYAKKTFLPFTLRNVSKPLVVERDSQMNALVSVVTAQLSSRTAWDASDIRKLYGG